MRKLFLIWISIGIGIAAFLFAGLVAYKNMGRWLLAADRQPQRLDMIFVFGGEGIRKEHAYVLLDSFPNAKLVISDYSAEMVDKWLAKRKIDQNSVIVVDSCSSTFAEVSFLAELIGSIHIADNRDPLAIGLVSSPYHMRRIRIIAQNIIKRKHARCFLLPVPFERYNIERGDYDRWWVNHKIKSTVLLEYQKIVHDLYRSIIR